MNECITYQKENLYIFNIYILFLQSPKGIFLNINEGQFSDQK